MSELLPLLLDWVGQHPLWAGFIVFLVALAESLAIVGMLVPGVVVLFGVGALIGNGTLAFWDTCLWACAGAIVGDNLSFWLGHHYENRFEQNRWFRLHPSHLQAGIRFFHRHGGLSIAFGRFFGPVRAVVPLVAGLMRMDPWYFFLVNLLSALLWAPLYLIPGMLFAASMEQAGEVVWRIALLLLLLTSLFFGVQKPLRGVIGSESLRQGLAALLLAVLLLMGNAFLHRGLPASAQLLPAGSAEQQGWTPLPPRQGKDLLLLFSPTVAVEQLPVTYRLEGGQWSVRPLDQRRRQLKVTIANATWLVDEQILDLWLIRLPLPL